MSILALKTIKVNIGDIRIKLPHPACFALHKLIIFQRRTKEEKAIKDKDSAIAILKMLIKKNEIAVIREIFSSIPKKWQSKILKGLEQNKTLQDLLK